MRHAVLAFVLSLLLFAKPLVAFELEAQRTYIADAETAQMRILSTADIDVFDPIIRAFQAQNPGLSLQYDVASSSQMMKGLFDEGAEYDLAISSAMDLQTKLANDGFAQAYSSEITNALPPWATWQKSLFAFTQEAAVVVASRTAFDGLDVPRNRDELIATLRDNPDRFRGRIGTYDVRRSGTGYLFATQEARNTENFWRLTEIMGQLDARLYCCTSDMLGAIQSGELLVAYNVLDSYSNSQLATSPDLEIIEMEDFVTVMLRSALIPTTAQNPDAAGRLIDFLVQLDQQPALVQESGLLPLNAPREEDIERLRPIRLGPGLLVFLDRLRRDSFLRSWTSAMVQNSP